jgi:hypothetical protein
LESFDRLQDSPSPIALDEESIVSPTPDTYVPEPMDLQTYIIIMVMGFVVFAILFFIWLMYEAFHIRNKRREAQIEKARQEIRFREKPLKSRDDTVINTFATKEFWGDLNVDRKKGRETHGG